VEVEPKFHQTIQIPHGDTPSTPKEERDRIIRIPQWNQFKINSFNYLIGKRNCGKTMLLNGLYSTIIDQIEEYFVFTYQKEKYQSLTIDSHIFDNLNQLPALLSYFRQNPSIHRVVILDQIATEIKSKEFK